MAELSLPLICNMELFAFWWYIFVFHLPWTFFMSTRDVKCSVFHTNEKQEKTCCCIKYWNQTFEELLSTNGISSKLCALTVSPLFYPFPNFQQCGVLRLSKCITSPICGQPTNQPPPYITILPEWSLSCLSKWMTSWLSGQPTKPPRLERWAIASHRLTDGGQPFGGTQKPSENHRTRWLPPTIPFNGDGCFENHRKNAMVR